ncbi:pyridoxamine 5'-phosphate oxidase family protein [Xanthomarina sp. F2636L]|uniref:pyridoxamine 5'-phosphate oxidase family protein n=1 Tax=Xanthomarina sp. F2636L TaxID=2996018 RepID=UPI00225E14F4|nr:pyridoxamine 5'-phosphate oxidase family protein [Xanthomarina sp. F2636L]MCX7551730.1 pyridoxamine 5'-phosphate oxidase family protein [Xanthomarina sp. F2636L]
MITDLETKECHFILENNYIGHLGYISENKPYVVPITYFFDKKEDHIICYSAEGHKIQAMRKNKQISLQVGEVHSVNQWKSVLVHGDFELHFGNEARAYLHVFSLGIKHIITETEFQKVNFIREFSSKIEKDEAAFIFLIKIDSLTGKKRNQ